MKRLGVTFFALWLITTGDSSAMLERVQKRQPALVLPFNMMGNRPLRPVLTKACVKQLMQTAAGGNEEEFTCLLDRFFSLPSHLADGELRSDSGEAGLAALRIKQLLDAATSGNRDYVRVLIAAGDDKYRDQFGRTALSASCLGTLLLLKYNADTELPDDEGHTTRDYAVALITELERPAPSGLDGSSHSPLVPPKGHSLVQAVQPEATAGHGSGEQAEKLDFDAVFPASPHPSTGEIIEFSNSDGTASGGRSPIDLAAASSQLDTIGHHIVRPAVAVGVAPVEQRRLNLCYRTLACCFPWCMPEQ